MDYEKLYFQMVLIREFEEKTYELYKMGHIAGFCHLYIGQEAVVVGCKAVLKENDFMITTYRDHAHMLVCDMDPKGIMAELTGKSSGFSKGKGGSMHMFSKEKCFMGGHGIVGATIPLGAGMAFAQKYEKTGGVTLAFCGDGAMNQGQVYEAFNMASLWKLPIVFIIEDNGYGIGSSKERVSAGQELYERALPFGIPGKLVNGMDIDKVIESVKWACEEARQNGPVILQFKTYRFKGHSVSDSTRLYRTKEEEQKYIENQDCITLLKNKIQLNSYMEEAIVSQIKQIVEEAAEFALSDVEPDASELFTDIFID